MTLDQDSIVWDGFTVGTLGSHDAYLGEQVTGFGHGLHRVAMTDRLAGGQAHGSSVPQSLVLEVDAWADAQQLSVLRAKMAARPGVAQLSWRGLGWDPAHELSVWATPTSFEATVDERAIMHGSADGVLDGLRCQWIAGDPTVYSATATTFTQATATTSVSWSWTNPGAITPLPGMGGRAWTVEITASGALVDPYVEWGTHRVTIVGTVPSGKVLSIGPDRIPLVDGAPRVGWSGTPSVPQPDWPRPEAGTAGTLEIGAASGSFTATGEFRGTW